MHFGMNYITDVCHTDLIMINVKDYDTFLNVLDLCFREQFLAPDDMCRRLRCFSENKTHK